MTQMQRNEENARDAASAAEAGQPASVTPEPGARETHRPLPKARITRNWKTWLFWVAPVGAAALAGWFIYNEVARKGPTLTIYFADAAGLQPGNSRLKYRGVEIGTVEKVRLTDDHLRAKITVALESPASPVGCGTRAF